MAFGSVPPWVTKKVPKPPPPSHSGGTSGKLSIPGWKNETPIAPPYNPAVAVQAEPKGVAPAPATTQRVEARQTHLVDKYVTKAYKPKEKGFLASLDTNVSQTKKALNAERDRLLNHPAVQAANEAGKVVGVKGLQRITQVDALSPAGPLTHHTRNPNDPIIEKPSSDPVEGAIGAVAGEVSKVYNTLRHQQPDSNAAPHFFEKEGKNAFEASKKRLEEEVHGTSQFHPLPSSKELQAVSNIPAFEGGLRVAESAPKIAEGVVNAAKTGATFGKALSHAPGEAADILRAAPDALRNTPKAIRDALKASPSALKGAAKAAPKAAGKGAVRGAVGTAENSARAGTAVAVAGSTNRAGVHIPGLENVPALGEGTLKALKNHPVETLETTGRVIPGFITGPAALGEAAVESAVQGSSKPLENTAGALFTGTKEMGEHLLSGNPKEVEKAIAQETGLAPYLPAPAFLHALHGSDVYAKGRGAVRKGVESHRAGKREATIAKSANDGKTAPTELGFLGRHREKNALKPPVPVPGTNESYVFRSLGEHTGAHKDRVQQALDATRAGETAHGWNQIEMNRLRRQAHGAPPGSTGPVSRVKGRLKGEGAGFGTSPLAKKMGRSYEAVSAVMAKYGLPHDPAHIRQMEEYLGEPADISRPDKTINDRIATIEAGKHPEIAADQRHQNFTNELRAGQKRIAKELPGDYTAKPHRIQNDYTNHLRAKQGKAPILKDSERVTAKADDLLGKKPDGTRWSRHEAWEHYENLKSGESTLRREARDARGSGDQARADDLYKQARETAKQRKALYGEISKFARHPEKIDTSSLKGSSRSMKRDFVREQSAAAKELGLLDPVHIHDEVPRAPAPNGRTSQGVARDLPGRATHFSTGEIARSGEADARLENVLHHSAIGPRTQIALNDLIHQSLNDLKTPVRMPDGSYKHIATEAERTWAENTHNMPAGTEWFPTPLLKAALNGSHALSSGDALKLIEDVRTAGTDEGILKLAEKYPDLKDEILGHNKGKGLTYTAVRSAGMNELVNQLKGAIPSKLRTAANLPTRLVLNDPAWVFAQLFATGIPLLATIGPSALLRAPQAIKAMAQIQKMDPASQARIKAMIGSSAGVLGTPHTAFSNADPYAPARAIKSSGPGKVLLNLAKGNTMGSWDRWNAAKMREFAATVRASKGFKNWYGGFKGLDKGMREISEATKGMSPSARLDWISRHPTQARDLQRNLNKMGGNWNSFTTTERRVAPFTIFYPWIRYSTTWVLHTFPMNHPVAGTMLAILAQRNAVELQKIAAQEAKRAGITGITPSTPLSDVLGYGMPVHRNAQNEPVENPHGQRFSPLGVVGQTVLSGDPLKAIGAANPLINTGISLATNKNTFTGQPLPGHGLLGIAENAAEQGLSLSPAARQIESAIGFRGFNSSPQSATSKAYEILAGGKGVKNLSSFADPYLTRPASKGALENALNTVEKRIGTTGHSSQSEVKGDETKTVQERQKIASKMGEVNKKAWTEKERLLRKIGGPKLAKQSREEYERYTAAGEAPGASGFKLGGSEKGFSLGGSSSGFSLSGSKNSKALNYKPPDESLHLPNIPGLSGVVGSITSPLTALIGGTPAQAAGLTKQQHTEVIKAAKGGTLASLHKKTLGKPPLTELLSAGKEGKLRFNSAGKITTPKTRRVQKQLEKAQTLYDEKAVPKIAPLSPGGTSTEFAKWFSHYSGIDPKVVAGWVTAEGAGETGITGGEAGRDNWLAARYAGTPSHFSETEFNEGPKAAAKKTVEWMERKAGSGEDLTSDGINEIIPKIKGKNLSPSDQIRVIGESGWLGGNAGELPTSYMANIAQGAEAAQVTGGGGAPKQIKAGLQLAEKRAKALGIPLQQGTPSGPAFIPGKGRYAFPMNFKEGGWNGPTRTDMGTDYGWAGQEGLPLRSIGSGVVKSVSAPGAGWEGGTNILIKLDHAKGLPSPFVFMNEGINATVKPGERVKKGQAIATSGRPPGYSGEGSIEIGFANSSGAPLAEGEYAVDGTETKYGKAMTNFLNSLAKGKTRIPSSLLSVGSGSSSFATPSGALTPTAVATYASTTGQHPKEVLKELKEKELKPLTIMQKLKQVEQIANGNYTSLGIPGYSSRKASSSLSSSLSTDRQALAKL